MALVSTKDPDYVNQLGYDADLIAADGIIKNGATSATITMTTGGETYYPGVVTSAHQYFCPRDFGREERQGREWWRGGRW